MAKNNEAAGAVRSAKKARAASLILGGAKESARNRALGAVAAALVENAPAILAANRKDVAAAEKMVAAGELSAPLLARLKINENKLKQMADGVRQVAKLPDPVGRVESALEMDRGLNLYRVSVPIGVIGCIFESRPDALVQISALAVKSGNAVLLKGGREAAFSNRALAKTIRAALKKAGGVPEDAVQLIETREEVRALLDLDQYINLMIPRGGNDLVRFIQNNTRIPVLGHADGICSVYVDRDADVEMAVEICLDAKTQYPAVCNAMETMLVHEKAAAKFLPAVKEKFDAAGVEMRGCAKTRKIVPGVKAAKAEDYDTEFLDLVLAVKIVPDLEAAVEHINEHGSGHTDAIVTKNNASAQRFLEGVDSACVMHNASTRFADGFRFGMGAEVGISTNKFHARGPVGLDGLVIYNFRLLGNGQTVKDYAGAKPKKFTHKKIDAPVKWSEAEKRERGAAKKK